MAGELRYAARASRIVPGGPAHDTPGVIMFASGDAYPESLPDLSEFAQRAATRYRTLPHGVAILPASHFQATPGPRHFARLAYSHASPSELMEGVRRLARAFTEL